jgi:hypothetical protein
MNDDNSNGSNMRKIPFYNESPNCVLNCITMALLHFYPALLSPKPEWVAYLKRKAGFGAHFEGGVGLDPAIGLSILREASLDGCLISTVHRGEKVSRFFLEHLEHYGRRTDLVFIPSLAYGHLRPGHPSQHAVVLADVTPDTIVYNDPAMEQGASLCAPREQFERAWRLSGWSTSRATPSNCLVVWNPKK